MAVKIYKPVEMDIGSGRTALIGIREDVITYFGIAESTGGSVVVQRTRKEHTRSNFDGVGDTTSEQAIRVERSTWWSVKRMQSRGAGIAVRVPTGKKSGERENPRFTTIRFPANAVIGAISDFLHTKCTANKPTFFIMPSGARYPVVNVSASDVNPGESDAGETTTP